MGSEADLEVVVRAVEGSEADSEVVAMVEEDSAEVDLAVEGWGEEVMVAAMGLVVVVVMAAVRRGKTPQLIPTLRHSMFYHRFSQ